MELCDHVQQLHTDIVRQSTTVTPLAMGDDDGGLQCPLCQSKCGSDRGQLESHLLQVNIGFFSRLLRRFPGLLRTNECIVGRWRGVSAL
jgi:hypothetical protein